MTIGKSGLLAIALVGAISGTSRAQFGYGAVSGSGFATYPGFGVNTGYYSLNSGFGNYGLPGAYPGYGGYGFAGYGPGANLGGYYAPVFPNFAPQTTNNLGGIAGAIRTQTGKGYSYRQGSNFGVSRRRGR